MEGYLFYRSVIIILNSQTNSLLSFIVKCWKILRNCVKVQSVLLLNAGLASFLTLPLVGTMQSFNSICKSTKDNKLREFGYKILHRVLVTNKGLKKFKITNDDLCDQCKTPDSLEHTFLQCPANVKFYYEILSWFNVSHNTVIIIFPRSKF